MTIPKNDKETDRRGYILVAIGLSFVLIGFFLLVITSATNMITYETRHFFWDSLAPVISYSIVIGSFVTVIGIALSKRISNALSYASVTGGFILIFVGAYLLLTNWVPNNINILGFDNFSTFFAATFFSYIFSGVFFMAVGVITGLKIRNRLAYVSIAGGLAIMLFGISILLINLADHLSTNYYLNLQLSWAPIISYSLIIGFIFVVIGLAYLATVATHRQQKPDSLNRGL
jgi:uncharacterized membrane protein